MLKNILAVAVVGVLLLAAYSVLNPKDEAPVGATSGPEAVYDALGNRVVNGRCNMATSTFMAIKNPIGATSTVSLQIRFKVNSATTTDVLIGTSTIPFVNWGGVTATGTMSKSLVALGSLAANTEINVFSGQTQAMSARSGETASFNTVYPATAREVMVGPTDSVVGYASTTLRVDPAVVSGTEPLSSCVWTATFRKAF